MSTIEMIVPINGNRNEMDGWIENVSQHIDAGNSVEFTDENGTDINIARIQLDTAGSIALWGAGYNQNTAQRIALAAGIWHIIPGIHGIDVANTDTGKGIHVKI